MADASASTDLVVHIVAVRAAAPVERLLLEVAMDVLGRPREAGDRAREAVHVGRVRLRLGAHLVAVAAAVLRVAAADAVERRPEDEATAATAPKEKVDGRVALGVGPARTEQMSLSGPGAAVGPLALHRKLDSTRGI